MRKVPVFEDPTNAHAARAQFVSETRPISAGERARARSRLGRLPDAIAGNLLLDG